MSKQITAAELAEIVTKILTTDSGGEIHSPAEPFEDVWYVGIHGNDSLPEGGGIWAGASTVKTLNHDGVNMVRALDTPSGKPVSPDPVRTALIVAKRTLSQLSCSFARNSVGYQDAAYAIDQCERALAACSAALETEGAC